MACVYNLQGKLEPITVIKTFSVSIVEFLSEQVS